MIVDPKVLEIFKKRNGRKMKTSAWKSVMEKATGFLKLYLSESSIHGLGHLGDATRHPVERVLWLTVTGLALWGAVWLSSLTWKRYQDSPTVISMDRDMFEWNTTYPGITLCPHKKLELGKLDKYVDSSTAANKTALRNFINQLALSNYSNFADLPEYKFIKPENYMELLVNLTLNFSPTLNIGTSNTTMQIETTITEIGICFTVNSKIAVHNTPRYRAQGRWDFVDEVEPFSVHPLDGEIFAQIVNFFTGYDVFLHGPVEIPDAASQRHTSPSMFFLKLHVTALTIYTSPDAAQLSIMQRKCRFPHESNLVHSPVYSYNLCRIDCRISKCIQLCGCVPHFYRPVGKDQVCNVSGLHCLAKHEEYMLTLLNPKTKKSDCACLPNCNDVNYVVHSKTIQTWFLGTNLQWGLIAYPKLRYSRDIIFGFTDLLASVGGMAGLFLGCSVLSFVELFYFYTLKLFWYIFGNLRKKEKQYKVRANVKI